MKTMILLFLLSISLIASQRQMPKYVVDAKNYGLVESTKAFYIIGSKKYGIMKESFAFSKEKDAQDYVEKNGGSVVDYDTYIEMDINASK